MPNGPRPQMGFRRRGTANPDSVNRAGGGRFVRVRNKGREALSVYLSKRAFDSLAAEPKMPLAISELSPSRRR